jgi:thioredoxin 1
MKKILFTAVLFFAIFSSACSQQKKADQTNIIHLTNDQFKTVVFNYSASKEWKYLGNKPAIIDFYADWCGPCRMMAPRLEEVAKKYAGKIIVYKVDTDKEQLLASSLGIQSLPTILFIPQNGKPQATMGAIPQESLEKAIHEVLLIK